MRQNSNKYIKLAELAVKRGVNVQPGQPLVIRADVRDAVFVELCVETAYAIGASAVSVDWRAQNITKLDYTFQSTDELANIRTWIYDREKQRHLEGACYLSVVSDKPGSLKDVDSQKLHAYQLAYSKKMSDLMAYTMNNVGQWCVIALPSYAWANAVFPDMDNEEAFEKLEEAMFEAVRIREDNDPFKEWQEHDDLLIARAEKLTEYQFDKLHFVNGIGTDLYVTLVKDHIWVGGGCKTPKGVYFDPNMPTEEIFCMPLKEGTDGTVVSSRPLSYNGVLIEDFKFVFEKGRVVSYEAAKESEALGQLLDFDEGSRYLGEVALVPYDSPISKSGILFLNTLFDENAACHLALGRPYPENLKGGTEMEESELVKHGANVSTQHHDFMFGTADMRVDGITENGESVPVFRNGNFVL